MPVPHFAKALFEGFYQLRTACFLVSQGIDLGFPAVTLTFKTRDELENFKRTMTAEITPEEVGVNLSNTRHLEPGSPAWNLEICGLKVKLDTAERLPTLRTMDPFGPAFTVAELTGPFGRRR